VDDKSDPEIAEHVDDCDVLAFRTKLTQQLLQVKRSVMNKKTCVFHTVGGLLAKYDGKPLEIPKEFKTLGAEEKFAKFKDSMDKLDTLEGEMEAFTTSTLKENAQNAKMLVANVQSQREVLEKMVLTLRTVRDAENQAKSNSDRKNRLSQMKLVAPFQKLNMPEQLSVYLATKLATAQINDEWTTINMNPHLVFTTADDDLLFNIQQHQLVFCTYLRNNAPEWLAQRLFIRWLLRMSLDQASPQASISTCCISQ
jgi:hypothetical protein